MHCWSIVTHALLPSLPDTSKADRKTSNNANAGGGYYSQGGQFYYIRGLGLVRNIQDIGNVGSPAQVILKRVEAMTKELNEHVLPPDVKIKPSYDRMD